MKPNVQKWLDALRSGKYPQGQNYLNDQGSFCCLGVACDLYQKEVGGLTVGDDGDGTTSYNGAFSLPPEEVTDWLGIQSRDGKFKDGVLTGGSIGAAVEPTSLVDANDSGATFAEIADFIEAHPDQVFA